MAATSTDRVSRPDKTMFPEAGVTKADVASYFERVAPHLLPHVEGRPLALRRYPDGIDAQGFFQKNTPDRDTQWLDVVELDDADGGSTRYAVVNDVDGLVHLADQAAIELHTLLVTADEPRRPVEVIFDLDPSDDDLTPVRGVARDLRTTLDDLGLAPRVKSSGSRGLHVVVDVIDDDADFELTSRFARAVARDVVDRRDDATLEQRVSARRGRLFVDVLRNARAAHAVAPYSLRARPEAPVAVPLDWDEALASSFHPRRITIHNVFRRLGQRDDPWSDPEVPEVTIRAALDELDAERDER